MTKNHNVLGLISYGDLGYTGIYYDWPGWDLDGCCFDTLPDLTPGPSPSFGYAQDRGEAPAAQAVEAVLELRDTDASADVPRGRGIKGGGNNLCITKN